MKISRRQFEQISSIMQDEAAERRHLHNEMYSNKKKSMINENFMFEADLTDNIAAIVEFELDQETYDVGMSALSAFEKLLYKKLSELVSRAGGQRVSPVVMQDDLEDFDEDGLMSAQQELTSDISTALHKYAQEVALLASHVYLSGEEPQE